jgi:hypothetical protein
MHSRFDDIEDATLLPRASLLRVLEGVAVATKAPEAQVEILCNLIREFQHKHAPCRSVKDLPKSAEDIGHPNFTQWYQLLAGVPGSNRQGLRQLAQVTLAIALLRERARRELAVDSTRVDKIWNLVHDAIVSAPGTAVQFTVLRSSQGFLSIPLCSLLEKGQIDELWRLHAWLPDQQRGVEAVGIHAHQPFGQSWTLLGTGTDHTFEIDTPENPSLATHAEYEPYWTSAVADQSAGTSRYQTFPAASTIRNTGRLVRVKHVTQSSHSRDMSYSVPAGVYHQSDVPGHRLHATLFAFDSHRGFKVNAGVVGPKDGLEYVQPRDPADLTAEVIAQIVHATRRWEQTNEKNLELGDDYSVPVGYYRFFRGMNLLRAGHRDKAMHHIQPFGEDALEHIFHRRPSEEHRGYIQQLRQVGVA